MILRLVGVLLVLSLMACGPKTIRLEPERVVDLKLATLEGGSSYCGNASAVELQATVRYRKGQVLRTRSGASGAEQEDERSHLSLL